MRMIAILLVGVALLGLRVSVAAQEGLQVDVQPERERYTIGEPVLLRCVFTNRSDAATIVNLGHDESLHLSFIIHDGTPKAAQRDFVIRRGGGVLPSETKVGAHQSFTRYIALDQWFRASEPGVVPMKLLLRSPAHNTTASFSLEYLPANDDALKTAVSLITDKYRAYWADTSADFREKLSYRSALTLGLSYLGDAPDALWADVRRRYGEEKRVMELIRHAITMGPGGIRVLD